ADTVPAYRADGRFSIAIATDPQISKTDRTQTADTVRSFDAPSQTVVVHLRNYFQSEILLNSVATKFVLFDAISLSRSGPAVQRHGCLGL
ncbi:MAG: hypothetical protein WB721_13045, partial [Pseudolabrys sp.]